MLKLKSFKKFEIKSSSFKGGIGDAQPYGWSYKCDGSDDGFSTVGSDIDFGYGFERCSGGFEVTPIF